jgi:NADH dehydrogenase
MKVSLIGGTGFVGTYIVEQLLKLGHTPRLLIRSGQLDRASLPQGCELVEGDIVQADSVAACLAGSDAAVYLIGILRELPSRGITFEELQYRGVERVIETARAAGIKRFLLMSANGVKPNGTAYQRTKYLAEEALKASGLEWTIFRPSVIFGDPRGRMEFCTQLRRDIVDSPLPAPLFYDGLLPTGAGRFALAPVAVEDVALAFVRSLESPETIGQTYELCGPDAVTWRQILTTIAAAVGKTKLMLPAPALAIKAVASVLDGQPWFPITRDQITMLLEGNLCTDQGAFARLGIEPRRFDEAALSYLRKE